VKIIMHGPIAGPDWHGGPALGSWAPDQLVEIDDKNAKAVAWARGWVAMGATLVEDAPADKPKPEEPEKRGPGRPRKIPAAAE
jgi:hypothetical protein